MPQLSTNLPWDLAQPLIAAAVNPFLANPSNDSIILQQVKLVAGANTVNTSLGARLNGWRLVRKRQWLASGTPTAYDISDTQDQNKTPSLTLNLWCTQGTATNPVIVDIEVF